MSINQEGERVKSVLISIRPEWCDKIETGEKTIEIRKNKPNIEPPFKCYIYEPKAINRKKLIVDLDGELPSTYARGRGKVIGEFICDRSIATNEEDSENFWICSLSCLSFEEIKKYIGYAKREIAFYGWHISDVVIYDKPKELNSFYCRKLLTRPPQSWCYVEEVSE